MIVKCRICFDEVEINECQQEEELRKNNFVSPCKCAGSNKYIHAKCLDQWRKQNVNNFMKCPTCAGIYNIFFTERLSDALLFPLLTSFFYIIFFSLVSTNFRLIWLGNIFQLVQQYLKGTPINYNIWVLRKIGYICNGYFEWGNNLTNKWLYCYLIFSLYFPIKWQISKRMIDFFIMWYNWQFYFRTTVSASKFELNRNIFPKICNFYLYDK